MNIIWDHKYSIKEGFKIFHPIIGNIINLEIIFR